MPELVEFLKFVAPNLVFAASTIWIMNKYIERGMNSLEERVRYLETELSDCLDREGDDG